VSGPLIRSLLMSNVVLLPTWTSCLRTFPFTYPLFLPKIFLLFIQMNCVLSVLGTVTRPCSNLSHCHAIIQQSLFQWPSETFPFELKLKSCLDSFCYVAYWFTLQIASSGKRHVHARQDRHGYMSITHMQVRSYRCLQLLLA
jgi:hypothetical protein